MKKYRLKPLLKRFFIIFLGLFLPLLTVAGNNSMSPALIRARTAPVGKVNIALPTSVAPTAGAASESLTSGKKIYETTCVVCHGSGLAGAPKFADKTAWKPRIAQGFDVLFKHVQQGYKAMPPKGTCTACSEADLKAAVNYLINSNPQK